MPKLIFLFTIITFSLAPHMSNSETYQIKDKSEPTFERKPLPRPLILTQQLLKEQVQKKRQPNMHTAAKYVKEGNYSSALIELQPLAREGIADAQALLGYMHLHGMGTKQDNETAFFWLNKSAEQGVVESYTLLGFMHLDGTAGAGKNGKEAEKWFLKASLRGLGEAQFQLAYLYDHGLHGATHDPNAAFTWYKRSAALGHPRSQHNLALFLLKGKGGAKQNPEEALEWLQRSAAQNHKTSQRSLAGIYFLGEVVEQNLLYAYMWASLSFTHDPEDPTSKIFQIITKYMSESEIKIGKELAASCFKKNFKGCGNLLEAWEVGNAKLL